MTSETPTIVAALGPTNTGKTHRAVERMLEYPTGMMGLPLRLLAREVYDRVTQILGESQVALVTGEEKRVPKSPRYWICTVEAMPRKQAVDFLAVDEIQLAAHPERGHVFTECLLHARGRQETWFMGSDRLRPLVHELVPEVRMQRFPRLSRLTATGSYSLGSLPRRSAVVAFSAPRVYELAERLRERRGGAAVVLGALSPRARNAQVAMYQAGEVDYLVATDAIGMGLNLEVEHIAFADRRKFDGREERLLDLAELSQIAGRAGRYQKDGAFGVLAPEPALPFEIARRIERHELGQERSIWWRNPNLCFDSVEALLACLKQRPPPGPLRSQQRAQDFRALTVLAGRPEILVRLGSPERVGLLWDVCQIPDYRGLHMDQHENLLHEVFVELSDKDCIADAWLEPRLGRLERLDGDIETLMQRIAFIRTWTYLANHERWLVNPAHWQARTTELEDKLSDALHEALVLRFIDSRLGRARHQHGAKRLDKHHPFFPLLGLYPTADSPSHAAPEAHFHSLLSEAEHHAFQVSADGRVSFSGVEVARLTRGRVLTEPEVIPGELELAPGQLGQVTRRLRAFAKDFVLETLGALAHDPPNASPRTRGLLYQLRLGLGCLPRDDCETLLAALTAADQAWLARTGIVLGQRLVFAPELVSPENLERRAALVRAYYGRQAVSRLGNSVCSRALGQRPRAEYLALGYDVVEPFVIRCDILEATLERAISGRADTLKGLARRYRVDLHEAKRIAQALGLRQQRRRPRRRPPRPKPVRPT